MTPDALHQAVRDLLRDVSARAILPYYQKLAAHQIEAKAADDVVTVADTLAEEMLTDGLMKIADLPVVGEEAAHADPAVLDRLGGEAVKAAIADYRLVDIPYCAAEQYPRLALGVNDVSIFERTLAWDHAAGVLWLGEAGGKAARPDGSLYRVDEWDRKGLIGAASPALWQGMAERLAGVPE